MLAGCGARDVGAATSSASPSSAASGTPSVVRASRFAAFVVHDGDLVRATGRPTRTAAGRVALCIPSGEPVTAPRSTTGASRIPEKPCAGEVLAYLVGVRVGPGGLTWQGRPVTDGSVEVTGRLRGDAVTVQTLTTAPNSARTGTSADAVRHSGQRLAAGPPIRAGERPRCGRPGVTQRVRVNLVVHAEGRVPPDRDRRQTGDVEQARAALSRVYSGALCVYSVPYSLTDLKRAQTAVAQAFGGLASGNLVSYGEGLQVATGEVGRINDQQAAALAPYAPFLQLTVYLVPAGAPR